MTRNDLYEVAFRYKKAGLWKKLWDDDVLMKKWLLYVRAEQKQQ